MSAPYRVEGLNVTLTQEQAERVHAQVEARKGPQPVVGQVYRHRETTDEKPFDTAIPSPYTNWLLMRYDGNNRWSSQSITRRGQWNNYGTSSPMTIAVQKGDWVPYTPPAISNATHAGRRVDHNDGLGCAPGQYAGRVVSRYVREKYADNGVKESVFYLLDNGSMTWCQPETLTLLD